MSWKPAAASVFLALTAFSQQPAPQSNPTFRSRTELVTVPVIVMHNGEHVAGLTKEAFQVEEDGMPKPLASFEEVRGAAKPVKPVEVPPDVYTNEVSVAGPPTVVVFLIDLINTPYFYQGLAKERLLKFLQTKYVADRPTMLVALHPSGLRVLHDVTTDPKILRAIARTLRTDYKHDQALDNQVQTEMSQAIAQQPDIQAEYNAMMREFFGDGNGTDSYQRRVEGNRLEQTFFELQQLAQALTSLRAMKSLVWVTGGITLPATLNTENVRLVDKYEQTLKLMAAASITVYPIDTILETDNPAYSSPQSRYAATGMVMSSAMSIQRVQNFMDITRKTGGNYCLLRKDPETCFTKAVDYTSQYYMLSYYAQPSDVIRWHKIEIKVQGAGLQVHARSGYYSGTRTGTTDERRKNDVAQAFYTPIESRGLPISVRWQDAPSDNKPAPVPSPNSLGPPQLTKRGPKQPFVLGIAADAITVDSADHNHVQLDIVAVALSEDSQVLADVTQQIDLHLTPENLAKMRENGFAYGNRLELPPHTVKVRFIVRDNLGERLGTVSAPPPPASH